MTQGQLDSVVTAINNRAKTTDVNNGLATKVAKVSSTDNAVVRFDGTTGNVKNSGVIIDNNDGIGMGRYPGIYSGYRTLTISGVDSSHGGVLELVNSDLSSSAQIFNTADRLNIGTNTNHPIVFNTDNTERLRIDSAGNVLMPSNKTISIGGTSNNYFYADTIGNTEVYSGNSVNLVVNGQNRLKIDSAGVLNVTSQPNNGRINIGASSNYIYGDTSGNLIIGTGNADRVNITSTGILVGNSNNGKKCIDINNETGIIQSYQHGITMNIPLVLNPASGGGNVLIGTNTDNGADKLQVNGTISSGAVASKGDTDLNNYKTLTQNFKCTAYSSNIPVADYGIIEVIVYEANTWILQRFTSLGNNVPSSQNTTWQRMYVNGNNWTSWKQITN